MEKNYKCFICNNQFSLAIESHLQTHGISLPEYEILFGDLEREYKSCNYRNDITNHKCNLNCLPGSDYCILHVDDVNKDKKKFIKIIRLLIKIYQSSKSEIHLEGIKVPIFINFSNIKFENNAFFIGSYFYKNFDLKVTSNFILDFRCCVFKGRTSFKGSKFLNKCKFAQAIFSKGVSFENSLFNKEASFWETQFIGSGNFFKTVFEDRVRFIANKFPDSKSSSYMKFYDTNFKNPSHVLFANIDLTRVLFRWTDISEIRFDAVNWPTTSKLKGSRKYIADEFYPFTKKKVHKTHNRDKYYSVVIDLYQQLKKNYEDRRNFKEAGEFYYGEMECIRKSSILRRYLPSFINLYKISSGYGQRYIRSIFVLFLLLLIFSSSHLYFGLKPNNLNISSTEVRYSINFSEIKDISFLKEFFKDFVLSITYCIEVITREEEQDRLFKPLTLYGEIVNHIFSILIYVQVLLFILALRRYFKR